MGEKLTVTAEMLESLQDQMQGVVSYKLPNGRVVRMDARAVREYGAHAILRDMGYGEFLPTERVPVVHHGRHVGTMPPDFDPISIKSRSLLYDPRPGDFRREGAVWVADETLGPGDLDSVVGFGRAALKNQEG